MSNIKYLNYDSSEMDNILFNNRLLSICSSVYRIDANQVFVNYAGSSKVLYENLAPILEGRYIIIIDVNQSGYYGYHNSSLWKWLKEQFDS